MLMSKAEYAKYKGVSRQTVYDWLEKGEVVMSGKKIDVEATEQRNSPPAQGKTPFLKCGQKERWK